MSLCVSHDITLPFIASTLKLSNFKNNYLELAFDESYQTVEFDVLRTGTTNLLELDIS